MLIIALNWRQKKVKLNANANVNADVDVIVNANVNDDVDVDANANADANADAGSILDLTLKVTGWTEENEDHFSLVERLAEKGCGLVGRIVKSVHESVVDYEDAVRGWRKELCRWALVIKMIQMINRSFSGMFQGQDCPASGREITKLTCLQAKKTI